jgi:hypothetical protein
LALVGLGLANLYLNDAPELAARRAMIAGGGMSLAPTGASASGCSAS